jgi:SAM-dependent methyltransferase
MSTAAEHYERHLAPVYLWMAGGRDVALHSGDAEVDGLGLPPAHGDIVVDLGAVFGMHAIPLTRRRARIIAIDASAELVRTLKEIGSGLPIQAIRDDLLSFQSHISETPSAILCVGDTMTHLPNFSAIEMLIPVASIELAPGGLFVISFRDYSVPRAGDERFIFIRGDETHLLTCFLEFEAQVVRVHDIIHERTSNGWRSRVSHYPKLRLAPERLIGSLESHGFNVRRESGMAGMVRLVARRC